MRVVNRRYFRDLSVLIQGIDILMGTKTESLWIEIDEFRVKDKDGNVVGKFFWCADDEEVKFLPAKT